MSIKQVLYGPVGQLTEGVSYELLQRQRTDGNGPVISRLVASTTWPSTHAKITADFPELEWINLSDLSFLKCKTSGGFFSGWLNYPPDRCAIDPDAFMETVYHRQYSGGWNGFWGNPWKAAQNNDVVADPIGPRFPNSPFKGFRPLEAWAAVYKDFCATRRLYAGVSCDMTPGRMTWGDWDGYLNDQLWLQYLSTFSVLMKTNGVRWWENSWGAGPRNNGGATGFKLEHWGNQNGAIDRYGLWGYLASFNTSLPDGTQFTSGLPTLTPAQRAESMLCINPKNDTTDEERYRHLMAGLATCHLFDIGYASIHSLFNTDGAGQGWWDANATWTEEIERMTRLEPMDAPVWKRWSDRFHYFRTPPDAPTCVTWGDLYGRRAMREPIGGQKYKLMFNPNDHAVGTMQPRSAKLVARSGRE